MIYLVDIPNLHFEELIIENLEIAYLASDLVSHEYSVQVIDGKGIHRNKTHKEIEEELRKAAPNNIIFYASEFTYEAILRMISKLKRTNCFNAILVGPRVVLGGGSLMENHKEIDLIISGDPISKLTKVLNGDFSTPGITYRKRGKLIHNEIQPDNSTLDTYPIALREIGGTNLLTKTMTDGKEYYIVPMRSSRGCTHNCSFCGIPAQNRKNSIKWRSRSIDSLMQEIRMLHDRYKNIEIRFLDENFSGDFERAVNIAESISQFKNIVFSFTARVDTIIRVDECILSRMYDCGLRGIEIGIENFNDNVLRRYRKGHTCQEAISAIRKIRNNRITPGIDFIMFDPWTTREELQHNMDVIKHEGIDVSSNPVVYDRLYPHIGTAFRDVIDMNSYFENDEISEIYHKMQLFKVELHKVRSILSHDKKMLSSLVMLKSPYTLLAELIDNPFMPLNASIAYRTLKGLVC